MVFTLKNAMKPEFSLIFLLCGGAVGLASAHIFKLSTDPHTYYSKTLEDRKWDKELPHRYLAFSLEDEAKPRPKQ